MIAPLPLFSTALVTGATGFIGRALVRRLVSAGVAVTATSRTPVLDANGARRVERGDLGDPEFARSVVANARPEVVFHLAARVKGRQAVDEVTPMLHANLVCSVNVLEAATESGCGRVVLAGSCEEPLDGEVARSPYAAAKASQSVYARLFHSLYDTPVTTARIGMVYGPDQPDVTKVVPYTITTLLEGQAPSLSNGSARFDWVYVDDVVSGLMALAAAADVEGQTIDVGTGVLHSVREVVETIVELTGNGVQPAWGAVPDRKGRVEWTADVGESARRTGWSPRTDLETGLAQTIEWHRADRDGPPVAPVGT